MATDRTTLLVSISALDLTALVAYAKWLHEQQSSSRGRFRSLLEVSCLLGALVGLVFNLLELISGRLPNGPGPAISGAAIVLMLTHYVMPLVVTRLVTTFAMGPTTARRIVVGVGSSLAFAAYWWLDTNAPYVGHAVLALSGVGFCYGAVLFVNVLVPGREVTWLRRSLKATSCLSIFAIGVGSRGQLAIVRDGAGSPVLLTVLAVLETFGLALLLLTVIAPEGASCGTVLVRLPRDPKSSRREITQSSTSV